MIVNSSNSEYNVGGMTANVKVDSQSQFLSTSFVVQSLDSVAMEVVVNESKPEVNEDRKLYSPDTGQAFTHKNAMISRIQTNNASQKYQIGPRSGQKKRSKQFRNGRMKNLAQKQVDVKAAALLLPSKEAQEEVLRYEVNIALKITKSIKFQFMCLSIFFELDITVVYLFITFWVIFNSRPCILSLLVNYIMRFGCCEHGTFRF